MNTWYKAGSHILLYKHLMDPDSVEKKQPAKEVEKKEVEVNKQQDIVGADVAEIQTGRGDYHNLVDILFVLDTTGSMGWCIGECKKTIKKIIKKFSDKQYNIKFALELYRDHPPQEYSYIEKHYDLTNEEGIIKILDKETDAAGGGDTPEAVMDGLYHGLKKTSWRIGTDGTTKSKRFLFHCCDAPPHGKQYGSSSTDKSWEQKGCPCGITKLDIQGLLVENKVDYSLVKVGTSVELMQSLFKECFSERFKRVMPLEIKSSSHKYKKSKKMKKKEAHEVMQRLGSDEDSPRLYLQTAELRLCDTRCDEMERKPALKMERLKKAQYYASQSDDDASGSASEDECEKEQQGQIKGVQRKRSMASLCCSQVESGLSDYEKQLEEMKAE